MSKLSILLEKISKAKIYKSPVTAYMKNFDQAKEVALKMQSQIGELELKDYNLNIEKQEAIEEIISGLLSKEMIDANIQTPLRKILYRYATTGISILDAENVLRKFILNVENKAGFAESQIEVLANEALSRFDGMISDKLRIEFNFDGFYFVGGLREDSSEQCIHLIKETGDLGKFAINGKYAVEDLPEIIRILKKNYKGVDPNLNESNFSILRLHKNCHHQIIYVKLIKKEKEILRQRKGD